MHKNIVAIVLSTVASTGMYGAEMASPESAAGGFKDSKVLRGPRGIINSVACSQNGMYVVGGSEDSTIRFWNLELNRVGVRRDHTDSVTSVAFSQDESKIASASQDKTIKVWDAKTWEVLWTGVSKKHEFTSLAWGPDQYFAFIFLHGKKIGIWDCQAQTLSRWLQTPDLVEELKGVVFSPDKKKLSSSSSSNVCYVWDLETGDPCEKIEHSSGQVNAVAWTGDGYYFLTACLKNTTVWDWRMGVTAQILKDPSAVVNAVVCPQDRQYCLTATEKETKLWDLRMAQCPLQVLNRNNGPIDWSLDGTKIITGANDGTIHMWNRG